RSLPRRAVGERRGRRRPAMRVPRSAGLPIRLVRSGRNELLLPGCFTRRTSRISRDVGACTGSGVGFIGAQQPVDLVTERVELRRPRRTPVLRWGEVVLSTASSPPRPRSCVSPDQTRYGDVCAYVV